MPGNILIFHFSNRSMAEGSMDQLLTISEVVAPYFIKKSEVDILEHVDKVILLKGFW